MSDRQPMIAGNWKLNGSRASVSLLASQVMKGAEGLQGEVVICPGFVHLADVSSFVSGSKLRIGAQNCSEHSSGAFTGEVSAEMLAEFECAYVIVGHSERRTIYAETDAEVSAKCAAVQAASMTPILCVGETLEEREAGKVADVIGRQLDAVLALEGGNAFSDMVVAYEPVWAIGTGKTASPDEAQLVHAMIRDKIAHSDAAAARKLRILYGGSVKPGNAEELFSQADIDGGLIGGAALNAEDFLAICQAAG